MTIEIKCPKGEKYSATHTQVLGNDFPHRVSTSPPDGSSELYSQKRTETEAKNGLELAHMGWCIAQGCYGNEGCYRKRDN